MNERFIALHITIDRIRPEAPSSAPAVMSSLFSMTKPIATAARPAYEFSSEMTVGMSAPPIGSTSSTPKASASTMSAGNRYVRLGSIINMTAITTAAASSVKLMTFCPRYTIGRVGITSCSLPAATRLPVQVR